MISFYSDLLISNMSLRYWRRLWMPLIVTIVNVGIIWKHTSSWKAFMSGNNMIASHFLASAMPNEAIGYTAPAQWSIINNPNRKISSFESLHVYKACWVETALKGAQSVKENRPTILSKKLLNQIFHLKFRGPRVAGSRVLIFPNNFRIKFSIIVYCVDSHTCGFSCTWGKNILDF